MTSGRLLSCCLLTVPFCYSIGCVSLDQHRQLQMHNRNLAAEKAELEQEVYDLRTANQSLRSRSDALTDQIASKDQLVTNLQSENDNLESSFRQAQTIAERLADRPLDQPIMMTSLPAELDGAIEQFAAQFPGLVTYDRARGLVRFTSNLLFPTGSDVVKTEAVASLTKFAEIMKSPAAQGFDALIAGHTDNVRIGKPATRAAHPTNWHLSSHRAIAVKDQLVKSGVQPTRVATMGFGEHRPLVANDSAENRARNRRVEIFLVPGGRFSGGASSKVMSFTGNEPAGVVK